MPNCYRCGRSLKDTRQRLRRRVKTGEWISKRYGKSRARAVQYHYGYRIVCKGCANKIDANDRRDAMRPWFQVLALGSALAILYLLHFVGLL